MNSPADNDREDAPRPLASLRALLARLRALVSRDRQLADDDLRAEFESHLEMEAAEYIRRGIPADEAFRRARIAAGGLTQAAEAVRDRRTLPRIEELLGDVRFAARALRHTPAFTAVVILTLALGIGANTAIFTVVRGVLLKPLPHREGERLVYLRHATDARGGESIAFSVPEVRDLREGARSLAGIAEFSNWSLRLEQHDATDRVDVALVTGNFFEVMGLSPILGRATGSADDGAGAPPVAVLTYDAWRRRFAGDSSIVGRTIRLDGKPVTVIGVLQPAPFYPEPVEMLLNMSVSEHHVSAFMVEGRTHRMSETVARLREGATLAQASAEVEGVFARMQERYREAYDPAAHHRVAVVPFHQVMGERATLTIWLLMGAAAFVLLISAANIANLSLMRAVRREHELVVRAALGAGVARLRRLLFVEHLLLTLTGGALGTVIALGGVRLLTAFATRYSPRAGEIAVDGVVLLFTFGLALLLAVALSLAPFLPQEGTLAAVISAGLRRTGGVRRQRVQRTLVVAQVAVSVVLLAGAGLLTRTVLQLSRVETGLSTEEVLTMSVSLLTPTQLLEGPSADAGAKQRYAEMLRELRALPGVTRVAIGSPGPLRGTSVAFEVKADGHPLASGETLPRADVRLADPDYFDAAGIPLVAGRPFAATDARGAAPVVILNRTLANRLFPGEDPIGQRVAWTGDVLRFTPFSPAWRTIVGVVADTRDGGLDASPRGAMYMPFAQEIALSGGLVIRAERDVGALVPAATRIVRRLAPGVPVEHVMTIAQIRDESVSPRRLNATLLSSFSLLAVLIAAVGITGVLAFSVGARRTELGIRMSLGASAGAVERMVLAEGGALLAAGLAIGLALSAGLTRFMEGMLFGVAPRDPATLGAVALLIGVVGLVACWIPAYRAARIDPVRVLRG